MKRGAGRLVRLLTTAGAGRQALTEPEVKGLLRELGLPVPTGRFVPRGERLPEPLGLSFPLVAKVVVPGLAHKSDLGGVRLGLRDEAELAEAVAELAELPDSSGVLVEEQAPPGLEVIVGGLVDPQFGPLVMFGLGGLFVELYRDVAFALAPLDLAAARRLLAAPRAATLLRGFRGRPPLDEAALAAIIMGAGNLLASGRVTLLDLNPVILYPVGAMVVDAKLQLRGEAG